MNRDPHNEVREKIAQAAQERLWLYGFKKTTIDEIAADAGIGKGTIYLHFSSKEEIALEIVTQFKKQSLEQIRAVADDNSLPLLRRIKEMLTLPVLAAQERYARSPATLEMVTAIRPSIHNHLKPLMQEEVAALAQVLDQGNSSGELAIVDTRHAAQTLKNMCSGFWPPYPCVSGLDAIKEAISDIVDMALAGCGARRAATEDYAQVK